MKVGRRVWFAVVALSTGHFVLHVGLGLGREAPDLLVVALLIAAREIGLGGAGGLGFMGGLMEDALSVLAFGANAVALTVVGIAGALTRDLFVGDSLLFTIVYFVVGKWARDLVHWFVVGEGLRQPFLEQVVVQGFAGGVYAAVVGVAVTALIGSWRELQR